MAALTAISLFVLLAYAGLFGALTYAWFRRRQPESEAKGPLPFVSVIVPVKNEERNIAACLTALFAQEYPTDLYEVLLLDDHSGDNTVSLASAFSELRILRLGKESGKKAALDLGVQHAKGDLIVTTDADCILRPGHLLAVARQQSRQDAHFLAGPVNMASGRGMVSRFAALEYMALQAVSSASAAAGNLLMASAANMAFLKDVYLQVSKEIAGSESVSGDDMFLLDAMKRTSGKERVAFIFGKEAIVTTSAPQSISALLRQRLRWVSKSRYYRDKALIAVALTVLPANLSIVAALGYALADPGSLFLAGGLYLMKYLTELPLLNSYARFSGQSELMKSFAWASAVYPFHAVFTGIAGLFGSPRWR